MFEGFSPPTENWSKLPHQFIDALPLVETLGELKVILYILRHTWGFQDDRKRLTIDEFVKGRKRRDGSRLDNGTGLSTKTVRDGLQRAEYHGFIGVEVDDHDKGRVKHTYHLRMIGETFTPQTGKSSPPEGEELHPRGGESTSRSEKDTNRKTPPERHSASIPSAVRTYRDEVHRFPAKSWWPELEAVTDLELWEQVVHTWIGLGWNPHNVKGMLDCYHRGEVPQVRGGSTSAKSRRRKSPPPSAETRRAFADYRDRRRQPAHVEAGGSSEG
jgi:hypothetical protein